ncbi:MAG TPA: PEPxxWA-CTERM sorting domain-containing protein, partial [Sphingomonas sp.]|nr:PEPxxWA-CTERM sorting domain-containing protein [Sphingomonas sp.]
RGFIPPDTMGAVGRDQYVEMINGGFGVWNKAGANLVTTSDLNFWAAAGQTGANGDSRVLFNAAANRWIALSFGSSVSDIQIAVSNTADATGTWKSTKFTGFAGGTADYPTMAMDTNALYIGTNNFAPGFKGTTLNIIPLSSLLDAAGPTTANKTSIVTSYNGCPGGCTIAQAIAQDRGFAIQGVNSTQASATGTVVTDSLFFTNQLTYDVLNPTSGAATLGVRNYLDNASFDGNGPGRQPNAVPDVQLLPPSNSNYHESNDRLVDTLDSRISSSVWEMNGKIYAVHTVTPTGDDYTVVRYMVIDAATKTLLAEGDIGDGEHDYYQGSLAVNNKGQVVIAYNRSGSGADGKITFAARVYSTTASGALYQRGPEEILKVSLVDDYHNNVTIGGVPCGLDGQVGCGRQRWGDYSAVQVDPNDPNKFWAIGEFAREYNNLAGGHPGGTGGSRWGTWISALDISNTAVPEPANWAMMIAGFGLMGGAMRRRRQSVTVRYA